MNGIARYQTVHTTTATQEELVVLAFEAAVRHQTKAIAAKQKRDHLATARHLRTVRGIFGELLAALDHEVAPELCRNLSRLYVWLIGELARVPSDPGPGRLNHTLAVTETLLEGWKHSFRKAA